jgi:ribosomal subunit interface protein
MRSRLGQGRGESHGADRLNLPPPDGFDIQIRSHKVDLPADVREYVRDRVAARLEKFAGKIVSVLVRFDDPNGHRGGVDNACQMDALLAGMPPVVVHERTEDLRSAVDLALDSLETAVRRHLERRVDAPRERGRKLVRNRKLLS